MEGIDSIKKFTTQLKLVIEQEAEKHRIKQLEKGMAELHNIYFSKHRTI